jgi:hypothetical protein
VAYHIRKLRKPDTPAIAITGCAESRGNSKSFIIPLLKPFEVRSLIEVVECFF